ncbi:MAG: transglutaminase domain-containing protein [Gemmatimonadota bacterium]
MREYEAAARLAGKPAPILDALARLYLDPRVGRPTDALSVARAARRLEPWREDSFFLQARAHEALGDQEAARRTYAALLANFPAGRYREEARRGLDGLSLATYGVTLSFRFENRGNVSAEEILFRVQAAQDFPPYSHVRLLELPATAQGRRLGDGTPYFAFEPFSLDPGEERTVSIRYAVGVSAGAYAPAETEGEAGDQARYLAAAPFIESDAPEIQSLARTLGPGAASPRERARRFYDFVLKRLTYVVQAETLGALGALSRPTQADCTEFAALFIALSRAGGIPARPVFGYLHEEAKERYDISHLWAEFWDPAQGWVSVDPTNGSLEPSRYFARVESNSIPLWVPAPEFGDLAGVRVTYRSHGEGDPLVTELHADIRRIPAAEFEASAVREVAFEAAGGAGLATRQLRLPVLPAAAVCAGVLGLSFWHRRTRSA